MEKALPAELVRSLAEEVGKRMKGGRQFRPTLRQVLSERHIDRDWDVLFSEVGRSLSLRPKKTKSRRVIHYEYDLEDVEAVIASRGGDTDK